MIGEKVFSNFRGSCLFNLVTVAVINKSINICVREEGNLSLSIIIYLDIIDMTLSIRENERFLSTPISS